MNRSHIQYNRCTPSLFKPLTHASITIYAISLSLHYYNTRGDKCLSPLRLWVYGQLIIHFWLGFVSFYLSFEQSNNVLNRRRGEILSKGLKIWWILFAIFLLYYANACVFLAPLLYWSVGSGALIMGIFIAIEWKQPPGPSPPPPPVPPLSGAPFCQDEPPKNETCPICIEAFKQGDLVSALSCEHHYHSSCINEWIQKTLHYPLCPVCRSPV